MMRAVRVIVLGAVTGLRSAAGAAALVRTRNGPTPKLLRRFVLVAAGIEFIGDKLPQTPSRLEPPGLVTRGLVGAVIGSIVSVEHTKRAPISRLIAGVAGAIAALVGAHAGATWRKRAAALFGRYLPGSLLEDLLATGTARMITRRRIR